MIEREEAEGRTWNPRLRSLLSIWRVIESNPTL